MSVVMMMLMDKKLKERGSKPEKKNKEKLKERGKDAQSQCCDGGPAAGTMQPAMEQFSWMEARTSVATCTRGMSNGHAVE